MNESSLRLAVTLESSWRIAPAAALRGLAKSGSSFCLRSLLMRPSSCSESQASPTTVRLIGSLRRSGMLRVGRRVAAPPPPPRHPPAPPSAGGAAGPPGGTGEARDRAGFPPPPPPEAPHPAHDP